MEKAEAQNIQQYREEPVEDEIEEENDELKAEIEEEMNQQAYDEEDIQHEEPAEEEISEDELKIVKIDVDENPETAQKFGIMSIPTLLFKKDGEVVKQVAGVHTKEQIKAIVSELS